MKFEIETSRLINHSDELNIEFIENWLKKNRKLFIDTVDNYRCSTFILPCFCCVRDEDCLFIAVYKKLSDHIDNFKLLIIDNLLLKKELLKYEKIKNSDSDLKKWLLKNLEKGLIYYTEFYFKDKNPHITKFNFNNGKNILLRDEKNDNSAYINFEFEVNNDNSFSYISEFTLIFCELFFVKKTIPYEYEKWKKDVGYIEM